MWATLPLAQRHRAAARLTAVALAVLLVMGCGQRRWSAFAQQCDPAAEIPDVQGEAEPLIHACQARRPEGRSTYRARGSGCKFWVH